MVPSFQPGAIKPPNHAKPVPIATRIAAATVPGTLKRRVARAGQITTAGTACQVKKTPKKILSTIQRSIFRAIGAAKLPLDESPAPPIEAGPCSVVGDLKF